MTIEEAMQDLVRAAIRFDMELAADPSMTSELCLSARHALAAAVTAYRRACSDSSR